MRIDIGRHEFTILWDGVLYKAMSDYPHPTDFEMRQICEFMRYEKHHGRDCTISGDENAVKEVTQKLRDGMDAYLNAAIPKKITECTACCQHGCMTDFLIHTADADTANKILDSGEIRSAVYARGMSAEALMQEERNAAKDPADFFDYAMFSWGNCQAGDRLIIERRLGHDPAEKDLRDDFTPSVRFCFEYERLASLDNAVFDGYHPIKIRGALKLEDNLFAVLIPSNLSEAVMPHIKNSLREKTYIVPFEGEDIMNWSDKAYCVVCGIKDREKRKTEEEE